MQAKSIQALRGVGPYCIIEMRAPSHKLRALGSYIHLKSHKNTDWINGRMNYPAVLRLVKKCARGFKRLLLTSLCSSYVCAMHGVQICRA